MTTKPKPKNGQTPSKGRPTPKQRKGHIRRSQSKETIQ